jgi:hypothetical protein
MPLLNNSETVLAQFNRLLRELLGGGLHRHTFRPWEIEILLDIESCDLKGPKRGTILRRYQKAVQRMMEQGARMPLRFAEYMQMLETGEVAPRKPAAAQTGLKLVPPREKKPPRREHFNRRIPGASFFPLRREE